MLGSSLCCSYQRTCRRAPTCAHCSARAAVLHRKGICPVVHCYKAVCLGQACCCTLVWRCWCFKGLFGSGASVHACGSSCGRCTMRNTMRARWHSGERRLVCCALGTVLMCVPSAICGEGKQFLSFRHRAVSCLRCCIRGQEMHAFYSSGTLMLSIHPEALG